MAHITHFINTTEHKTMERKPFGPRAETLAVIRQFARTCRFEPKLQPNINFYLVN